MNDFDDDLHVDLTPLIDVIFMLVIFFIMTMSFTAPAIDFQLPKSETATQQSEKEQIVIAIDKEGNYIYKGSVISKDDFIEVVKNSHIPTINLNIAFDAPSQYLIDVADISRKYAEGRISITTIRENSL